MILSSKRRAHVTLKQFSPAYIRTHGFLLRNSFFRMDGETCFNATRELFAYMASFPCVSFVTSSEYAKYLSDREATHIHPQTV
jgi:hypothetical protein